MLKNYLWTAVRQLRKNPVYSGLNILGLAVGTAFFLLIFLWVEYETGGQRALCLSSDPLADASGRHFFQPSGERIRVTPLLCPQCGGAMKIIAFLTDYAVVDRIIAHLMLTFVADRPLPPHLAYQKVMMAAETSAVKLRFITGKPLQPLHSYLRASTGSVRAALKAW